MFCGFIGFLVSMVSWFHRYRGIKGFMVLWCQWFRGVNSFIVSCVSGFHRFLGVNGFMVS